MLKSLRKIVFAALVVALTSSSALACTVVAVGKNATVDGSAIITHNDDSRVANSRLYIVPEADWPEGAKRNVVKDAHGYDGDAQVIGQIPQVPHTFRYFASRYSFMNENGVAIAESTNSVEVTDDRSKNIKQIMGKDAVGMMDAWIIQDIMLERASTAREAVQIMGKLVEEYGWFDAGETMPLTDGNEVWIIEFYGNKIWAAWRMPDDHIFVGANRARLRNLDLTDAQNVMACPDIVDYAVKNGFIAEKDVDKKNFSPADVYAPNTKLYSTRREWRVLSLAAPQSFKLGPDELNYPISIKPDKKLSVHDVLAIKGDWYEGTPFDLSKGIQAGPWGNPIRFANSSKKVPGADWERSVNMMRSCYVHIAQVRGDLPAEVRGISWFGYGAADTTYITPLWPIMTKLPPLYGIGDRYHDYDPKSGWWVNTRVQELAGLRYQDARTEIHKARDAKLIPLYIQTPMIQDKAAEMLKAGDKKGAVELITDFAYAHAVDFNQRWLALGDRLLSKYALGYTDVKATPYPEEWNEIVGFGVPKRGTEQKK